MRPTDSGMRPTDSGMRPTDSGMRPTDSGMRLTDSGMRLTDSGMRLTDSSFPSDPELETSDDKQTPLHLAARYIPIYHDDAALQEDQEGNEATVVETRLHSSRRAVQYLVKICRAKVNCQVGTRVVVVRQSGTETAPSQERRVWHPE